MKFAHVLILGLACALPLAASAQWQWTDGSGKRVFSDQPPPIDVPEKNILRRPAGIQARVTAAPSADSAPAPGVAQPTVAASAPKPSGVDKELEEKTRKAEEAEKAKQAAEKLKVAQAKADNCTRAKQGKATFDSGIRVARVNAQGEREIMDDKARAAEGQRIQTVIDNDCK